MTAPKFLILDEDLQVVGMASSKVDVVAFGLLHGEKNHLYRLDTEMPDREIAGLDKLTSVVTKHALADQS